MMRTLAVVFAILLAESAAAQPVETLFEHRLDVAAAEAQLPRTGRRAVVTRARVGLRLDRLFGDGRALERVLLNTGDRAWIARFERLDRDRAGFRSWVGVIEGVPESHVVITERAGVVSGLINAVDATYQLRTDAPGTYVLERVDVARLADERDPMEMDRSPVSSSHDAMAATNDDGTVIDVLLLYTPAARVERGGTAHIDALVSQIISDTNTAFSRSGIAPRVRLAAAREIAWTEAPACPQADNAPCGMSVDLSSLRDSTVASALRDQYRADLVQLLVHSPDLSSCGVGYLLTSTSWKDFPAFSIADIACAAQYTPTHEMGHNMGSHHAPEDGASRALFDYSYGFKDASRGFRTVMAYSCSGASCSRVLNFSNPAVFHNGGPTGTAVQDNARSINAAALAVANFRQASTGGGVPRAPTGLRASVSGNSVSVAWDPVFADATNGAASSYVLQVGSAAGAADLFNASVGAATSASGIVFDGAYYWRVIALNTAGASGPSSESLFTVGCVAPSPPQHFTFSVTGRIVSLAWQPPAVSSGPVSYIVEAGSAPGLANLLAAPVGNITSGATEAPPATYFVRVRALNACGVSGASNEQTITVP